MSRDWNIGRDDAELIVDLLEDCNPAECLQRYMLAAELRQIFGMVPFHRERVSDEHQKARLTILMVAYKGVSEIPDWGPRKTAT